MTHLKVAIRVRPLSLREINDKSTSILNVENDNTITITNLKVPEQNAGDSRERTRRFAFDFCFNEHATQDNVFNELEQVVSRSIKCRYNSCVLAYGQSSTGKTYTMMGTSTNVGLTPRLCSKIFTYIQESASIGEEISACVSYLEIYNEKVRDLLVPTSDSDNAHQLRVREHPQEGPYVQGLSKHTVQTSEELLELLTVGTANRRVAATLTNCDSSRSHSVLTITCAGVKLNLVDLAGSERAGNRCYGTARFREGTNINKSLVALGNVISALAAQEKSPRQKFVPYRDSVLTWLLKDTLAGNSNTIMIATVSPSNACYTETINTLRFGQRAKLIVSEPVISGDTKELTIRQLRAEIVRLRELLQITQTGTVMENQTETITSSDTVKPPTHTTEFIPTMDVTSSVRQVQKGSEKEVSADRLCKIESRSKSQDEIAAKSSLTTGATKQRPAEKPQSSPKSSISNVNESKSAGNESPRSTWRAPLTRRKTFRGSGDRSQIVAAVTSRLYGKAIKREASTNTNHGPIAPKELSICANARSRLKELTWRAMQANRFRSEGNQTESGPVLRVKDCSTDVQDLRIYTTEQKHAMVSTTEKDTIDQSVSCGCLASFLTTEVPRGAFVVTRSCGTQTSTSVVSFTKYLERNRQANTPDLIAGKLQRRECLADVDRLPSINWEQIFPLDFQIATTLYSYASASVSDYLHLNRILVLPVHPTFAAQTISETSTIWLLSQDMPPLEYECANELECDEHQIVVNEPPTVLKSIMKPIDPEKIQDSLEYYRKRKVHFHESKLPDTSMQHFLYEASQVLQKIKCAIEKIPHQLDVELTIKEPTCSHSDINLTNKYDKVVNEACSRLEERLHDAHKWADESTRTLYDMNQRRGVNRCYSSLNNHRNSNSYSAASSLRHTYLSWSPPSHYLRHLTEMRSRMVDISRDEFRFKSSKQHPNEDS